MNKLPKLWALLGVTAAFLWPIIELGAHGVRIVGAGLSSIQWAAFVVLGAAFLYGEGIRAIQRRWVPRMFARVRALGAERSFANRLLAPLYAMSLIGAPVEQLRPAWTLVAFIAVAAAIVRQLPEPWRGIVDLSVAVALAWGLCFIVWSAWSRRASSGAAMTYRRREL